MGFHVRASLRCGTRHLAPGPACFPPDRDQSRYTADPTAFLAVIPGVIRMLQGHYARGAMTSPGWWNYHPGGGAGAPVRPSASDNRPLARYCDLRVRTSPVLSGAAAPRPLTWCAPCPAAGPVPRSPRREAYERHTLWLGMLGGPGRDVPSRPPPPGRRGSGQDSSARTSKSQSSGSCVHTHGPAAARSPAGRGPVPHGHNLFISASCARSSVRHQPLKGQA